MTTMDDEFEDRGEDRPFRLGAVYRAAQETGAFWPTASGCVFLLFLIVPAWISAPVSTAIAVTALAILFGVQYVLSPGVRSYPLRQRVWWLSGIWAVLLAMSLLIGADIVFMVMYVVVVHAVLLPWSQGRVAVVVLGLAGLGAAIAMGEQFAIFLAIAGIMLALVIGFSIQRSILETRLERAEERNAVLAVAAERERIGRDLHDILGHSLTTITVTAQLARRLVEADPQAAAQQLAEIERISRQSLADVRATASGMQQVRAATEIASARSVLTAAGIEADVPAALPALPDERAELFGYVIREGITNVVRHSRAARCTIRVDERSASVADDGRGIPAGKAYSGLAGLGARVRGAGGELRISENAGGGTLLRAEFTDPALEGSPA